MHRDAAARRSAGEIGARAYTSGNHVVLGEGGGDQHTLAHELTHVIQQRQGPVVGTDNGTGAPGVGPRRPFRARGRGEHDPGHGAGPAGGRGGARAAGDDRGRGATGAVGGGRQRS
ncbi:DUF4157 domain-containing protein [Streptomyces chrestomyceticus]|uniref:eCIS core domain-containing protein n=1 Tax=Streptomyces chrestomyceticus TaxID=68185 RepID=UPI0035A93D1B